MNPLQQAAAINNESVFLLEAENLSGAIHSLQRAIIVVKDGAKPVAFKSEGNNDAVTSYRSLPFCVRQCHLKLRGLQNGVFYVYDRPFLIATGLTPSTQEDYDAIILLFSTHILFNFALAWHQLGAISGRARSLRRAGELYEFILKILRSSANNDTAYAVLKCLVLNNLAHIHYERCQYEESKSCIDSMFALALKTDCLESYIHKVEISEILLNIIHVRPPTIARAA